MTVFVNEKKILLQESSESIPTVTLLLREMNIPEKGTAVALNNHMIRRDDWAQQELAEGDKILLIKAAYGG